MKHLTLTLLLTVFVLSSGAAQRLVVRQINSDYVFAQNDEILTIRETIRMLAASSESQQLLKSSRFYTFTGQVLSLSGGALIGTVVADVILNTYGEAERTALWLIAGTGAAFVAVGFTRLPLHLRAAAPRTHLQRGMLSRVVYRLTGHPADFPSRPV